MEITYLGHASFQIKINQTTVLIDPFISANPLANHIDVNSLQADYILLTHAHQDHVLDAEAIAKNTEAVIVSNYEIVEHYIAKGCKGAYLNHGGILNTKTFSVKYVNAIHTSSFADGSYGGQPGGFVLTANNKTIYIAGDTALTMDMKLIPLQFNVDVAIFPIGDTFTMGVKDAILASDFVECNKVLGCHFNTFPPIEINKKQAVEDFKKANKELILLDIGNHITL